MDNIVIDDIDQSGQTYLAETRDKVFMQQGGVCTRFSYDKCTVMDLDTFLTKEVKNLSKMRHNTMEVFQLKDLNNNYTSLILGDEVVKYNLTNVEQVPMSILTKELQANGEEVFVPDLHYPIVQYKTKNDGSRDLTILIPPTKRNMLFKFPGLSPLEVQLTLPEMWLRILLNSADSITDLKVAVIKERCRRSLDTTLYMLPLPHMYANGHICLGSATVTGVEPTDGERRTNGEIAELAISMLFNSTWTNHLIASQKYDKIIGNLYEEMPKLAKITDAISNLSADRSTAQCIRCIRCLMHPTGYLRLNYDKLSVTAASFLGERI